MTLKEFLANRPKGADGATARTRRYAEAVERLMDRLTKRLTPYEQLSVEQWLPLLKEHGVSYNAPAITVLYGDEQVTIEPVGTYLINSKGRVRMTNGVREVHLDWDGTTDDWTYRWVNPRVTTAEPLSDVAVEEIVQGLLA